MSDEKIRIPHNFIPRWYQRPLYNCLERGIRRAIAIWHRRAGKDKTFINVMARELFKRVGVYYYFFPTYAQGRKILWDGIDKDGFKFLDHIPRDLRAAENSTEMKITLRNGSIFQVIGTDKFNRIVGPNPIGCVFSEYSLQDPRAWGLIQPILAENEGWALFNCTPRGKNHAYTMYRMSLDNPDWFSELLTVEDTKAITQEAIEQVRREGMSEDLIRQEFYCSFEASIPGAYYANEMRMADEQGRVCKAPVEPNVPVNTYWDLGHDDSTSIWLGQDVGREVRFVGYYTNSNESIVHYVNWLKDWRDSRRVTFGTHYLPHDGAITSLQTGMTMTQYVSQYGLDAEIVRRPQKKDAAIEMVRQFLSRCWFDREACEEGLESLKHYRKEFNEKNGVYAVHPVHDWASHGADAMQTAALQHQTVSPPRPETIYEPHFEPIMDYNDQLWMR
ncbi:MAG: hypothetical protein J7M24_00260 [Candidatus Latescibacteria bacterium]|nr:hypothetical protein [Candidatus Latescibacterota bacterium]